VLQVERAADVLEIENKMVNMHHFLLLPNLFIKRKPF
jgi:hypothetical protein